VREVRRLKESSGSPWWLASHDALLARVSGVTSSPVMDNTDGVQSVACVASISLVVEASACSVQLLQAVVSSWGGACAPPGPGWLSLHTEGD
jgi:hypothetical protein